MNMILPIIACVIGVAALIVMTVVTRKNGSFKKKEKDIESDSVHEFINIKDVRNTFLYTKDNKVCTYFKVKPITLDLLSQNEKRTKCRQLSSKLAGDPKPWRFIAVSRPVDISPLIEEYSERWRQTNSRVIKEILSNEMMVMSNFSHSGEVAQRQFYFMLWEEYSPGIEKDLEKRMIEFKNKFAESQIQGEILKQQEIVRLCNLVNNPAYSHLEDMDDQAAITTIMGLYQKESDQEGVLNYATKA